MWYTRYIWASSKVYIIYNLTPNTYTNYFYAIETTTTAAHILEITPNKKNDKTYSYKNNNKNTMNNNNSSNQNVLHI